MIQAPRIAAELIVDLNAVVANWRLLAELAAPAECAAVVKANAYGLGDVAVASALYKAGCRSFYVATLKEALTVTTQLPGAALYILNGLGAQEFAACREHTFIPVLSTLQQIKSWRECNRAEQRFLPCVIQVDTGMNRLGLNPSEWRQVVSAEVAAEIAPIIVMSHLACAEDKEHPLNSIQRLRFEQVVVEARAWVPSIKASFANSGGVCLGADFHFDQVRTGIAMYGGNLEVNNSQPIDSNTKSSNRFRAVVSLRLPIVQLRRVELDGSAGYGATAPVAKGSLLATVHSGYADGLLISQSQRGCGEIAGQRVPMLGRISMDLSIFDVSAVPNTFWQQDSPAFIEVLNSNLSIDAMAEAASTISYEILTRLGARFERRYLDADV